MSEAVGARWYVVQTQVNCEAKAAENLLRQDYEVYLPRYLKRRRHARKVDFTAKPLFPRYIFVAMDVATRRWRSIQSTIGVSYLVCNGHDPAPMAEDVLRSLKAREDVNGLIRMDIRPRFSQGERVRVLSGPFSENLALFDGMGDRDRIAILLDLLGRKVRVSLDADMVAAA